MKETYILINVYSPVKHRKRVIFLKTLRNWNFLARTYGKGISIIGVTHIVIVTQQQKDWLMASKNSKISRNTSVLQIAATLIRKGNST